MRIEQSPEFQIHLQNLRSKEPLFLETIYNVGNGHLAFGIQIRFRGIIWIISARLVCLLMVFLTITTSHTVKSTRDIPKATK